MKAALNVAAQENSSTQLLNRLAAFFGEVQNGSNNVETLRLHPKDAALLDFVRGVLIHDPAGSLWGATVIVDATLREGTGVIDKLGKRMLR